MADQPQITLEQLLSPQSVQQIFNQLISVYQSVGFPVTSWQIGGTERTRVSAIATVLSQISSGYIPTLTASGFVDFAKDLPGEWMPLLAQELYNIAQTQATHADGYILLTSSASADTQVISAGDLMVLFPSGNRYINIEGGTLSPSSTLSLAFESEFAQNTIAGINYNQDITNSPDLSLVNPIAGVTVSNPASTFTTPTQTGGSIGTLTPSGSSGGEFHYIIINVETNGNITDETAEFSYSLDGADSVPFTLTYAGEEGTYTIPDTGTPGVTITLSDDGYGTISSTFYEGDSFQFQTPGSWFYQIGVDVESNEALATRCKNQWNTLSQVPTQGFYEYIVASASTDEFPFLGAQATNILVLTDGYVNNKVNIIVASPTGPLSPQSIVALQSYVNAYAPLTDNPVILSPDVAEITLAATVYYQQSLSLPPINVIAANINIAIINYIQSVGINPTLKIAQIIEEVMTQTGVTNILNLTISVDGDTPSSSDVTLGSSVLNNYVLPVIYDQVTFDLLINFTYIVSA